MRVELLPMPSLILPPRRRGKQKGPGFAGPAQIKLALSLSLVAGEAVEQPVAAGAAQIALAAAAVRTARGMRRVPRLRCIVVTQALPVDMADHGRALGAAG